LLLARDHAGIKPLYYFVDPHQRGLAFGSQFNCLLHTPWGVGFSCATSFMRLIAARLFGIFKGGKEKGRITPLPKGKGLLRRIL